MSKEAMKLARNVLKTCRENLFLKDYVEHIDQTIKALEEALAKQEQGEPERCHGCEACMNTACGRDECPKGWPKAPQQRTWVGLTDDERLEAAEIDGADEWFWKVCKAIEAKLKEKNT